MKRIVVPTQSADDWKRLLAKPDLHWKPGYSAMTLAQSWEDAHPSPPPEVVAILGSTGDSRLDELRLVLAIPEWQVDLPGGSRPSQTDLLALMRGQSGLVVVAVEGKVDETLGPTVGEKRADNSAGVGERLAWLISTLGIQSCPDSIRYQLLHRTASALLVAREFDAAAAVMLVHSFSPTLKWFDDFAAFARLYGERPDPGELVYLGDHDGTPLWVGWCCGDQRYRERV
ncbi:MAG: hypothetical protein Kow0056_04810 [Coriobacteriia bacterium]